MFKALQEKAFIVKNITSSFKKTGIFPYNPTLILDKIQQKQTIATISSIPVHDIVRRTRTTYEIPLFQKRLSLILQESERLATQHSIDKQTIVGLIEVLQLEKKKLSRRK